MLEQLTMEQRQLTMEQRQFQQATNKTLARLVAGETPDLSPGGVADRAFKDLTDHPHDRRLVVLKEDTTPAVFDATTQELAKKWVSQSEREFCAFMTSPLELLFPDLTLVDSESFSWLCTSSNSKLDQSPDFFLCESALYETRFPQTDTSMGALLASTRQTLPGDFRFGVIPDRRLYDSVYILDAKRKIKPADRGELITHLRWLGASKNHPRRGMLFDAEDFVLIEVDGPYYRQVIEGRFSTKGSLSCIREFFPPFRYSLKEICNLAQVTLFDPKLHKAASCGFLGAGGSGRVFRVVSADADITRIRAADIQAVKVVERESQTCFQTEFNRLSEHRDNCECNNFVRPVSQLVRTENLCGYVMSPVGAALTRESVLAPGFPTIEDVFLSLCESVHNHHNLPSNESAPIAHGDSRLPNVLLVDKGVANPFLAWCDLRYETRSEEPPTELFKDDMTSLVGSFLPEFRQMPTEFPDLEKAIRAYSATAAAATSIARLVKDAITPAPQEQYEGAIATTIFGATSEV
jgi:hypothetical protein